MEDESKIIEEMEEQDSTLSEYDRKLLKATISSNLQIVVQMKKNKITISRLLMTGMNRLIEFAMLLAVSLGGLQLYNSLPSEQQQDIASKALHQGIPVLLAVGVGKTHLNNKKDNKDLDSELESEDIDIDELVDKILKESDDTKR